MILDGGDKETKRGVHTRKVFKPSKYQQLRPRARGYHGPSQPVFATASSTLRSSPNARI